VKSVLCGAVSDATVLQHHWTQLLQAAPIPTATGTAAFAELCQAYQQQHRHYHTLAHLEHMLGLVYDSGNAQPAALWATWYHDCVYRPGRSDNEARSAEHAHHVLIRLQVADPIIARCEQIILATRSHTFDGTDAELQGVLDADMAILGTPPQRYLEYCAEVRREFALTPGPLFRRGRRRFIEQVLAQSRIFATDWFWQRFETQARDNLASELARL
jgi:predicted metal-dependent HD superfamily phosphohydrolase